MRGSFMTIFCQGRETETAATTVAAFLAERGIDGARAIVEYAGEVYAPGADLSSVVLKQGAALEIFKVMAGG